MYNYCSVCESFSQKLYGYLVIRLFYELEIKSFVLLTDTLYFICVSSQLHTAKVDVQSRFLMV